MGDVGSLALGGLLAAISIILHQEWTLLLMDLSTFVKQQVLFYKLLHLNYLVDGF